MKGRVFNFRVLKDNKVLSYHSTLGKCKDKIDKDCVISKKPLVYNGAKYFIEEYWATIDKWYGVCTRSSRLAVVGLNY